MDTHEAFAYPETHDDCRIVGSSRHMRQMLEEIEKVARTDSTVLIQGETGTGKELVARAVHLSSGRARGPFVKLNCAAIPSSLFESELFGHEKGAFTGAVARRVGRFEQAQHGTLFLDEIGEMPQELQPKLLRVLQEREFERLGSTRTLRSDVRVLAATNRDLHGMVEARQFREDLFYRLSVFPIRVPALRERREDIPPLAYHFMRHFARRMQREVSSISPAMLARLEQHDWPGNIRELQNVIERAVILATGNCLDTHLPALCRCEPSAPRHQEALEAVSRAHILSVLRSTNWVIAGPNGAAARLGMKRTTLNFRMKKLGIVREACALR
jgi:transcriptional regulator with GAF, ATPase, and Fis domain